MIGTITLVLGLAAAVGTVLAALRVRWPYVLNFPVMMISWLVGELAVFHAIAQLLAGALLVSMGALERTAGRVGVAALTSSAVGLLLVQRRAQHSAAIYEDALAAGLGADYADGFTGAIARSVEPPPRGQAWRPFRFDTTGVDILADIAYGDHPRRNRLDVYRPSGTSASDALPVVIFIHGGGWVIGNKEQQGKPMLLHLARRGYVCVTINYRLAPRHRWPAQVIDVKRAIAWVHDYIDQYGGDATFLAVSGSSAGGHLASLSALTQGDPAFQPGFEDADTSLTACIPLYAPFDFTDRAGIRGRGELRKFLERLVMTTKLDSDRAGWEAASPVYCVNADAPPTFVIQGAIDTLVWREESRHFVEALRSVAPSAVVYAELPGAQHAFEVFNSARSVATVDAIARFLAAVRITAFGKRTT
jgi:acetyl esterase/lipase